jgi:hypothetical protein
LSDTLTSDATVIGQFLSLITADWMKHSVVIPKFEIRCLGQHQGAVHQQFVCSQINEAVQFAQAKNAQNLNIYTTINPIDPAITKNARDQDILRAHFSFADADDLAGYEGLKVTKDICCPDLIVRTGTKPHYRIHAYWKLEQPCLDMVLWKTTQSAIAKHFKTDAAVINPSRIMRLPGTISYPNSKKQQKGYEPELVTLKVRPT